MAQFDLHQNKGPMKDTIPYVVVVQSSLFDGYRRRVVVPLVKRSALPAGIAGTRINPSFKVRGAVLVLNLWTWFQWRSISWESAWVPWLRTGKRLRMRWMSC
jgi:hypothetical protein